MIGLNRLRRLASLLVILWGKDARDERQLLLLTVPELECCKTVSWIPWLRPSFLMATQAVQYQRIGLTLRGAAMLALMPSRILI
jgi:hypothetical protein